MSQFEVLALMSGKLSQPPDKSLQICVSDDFTVIFTHTPRPAMILPQNRKDALHNAAERQRQLEACMSKGTTLAMRSQTFMGFDDVDNLVAANKPLFQKLCQKLNGKVQFQIIVNWQAADALKRFSNSPELAPLFEQGHITPATLQSAIANLTQRLHQQIGNILSTACDETITLPITAETLINMVLLVDQANTEQLDRALEVIDDIWTEGFHIKQIGPAPAASFALLAPRTIVPTEITQTLQKLKLQKLPAASALSRLRKIALKNDPEKAAEIKKTFAILEAVRRVGATDRPMILCAVHVEGQTQSTSIMEVA